MNQHRKSVDFVIYNKFNHKSLLLIEANGASYQLNNCKNSIDPIKKNVLLKEVKSNYFD